MNISNRNRTSPQPPHARPTLTGNLLHARPPHARPTPTRPTLIRNPLHTALAVIVIATVSSYISLSRNRYDWSVLLHRPGQPSTSHIDKLFEAPLFIPTRVTESPTPRPDGAVLTPALHGNRTTAVKTYLKWLEDSEQDKRTLVHDIGAGLPAFQALLRNHLFTGNSHPDGLADIQTYQPPIPTGDGAFFPTQQLTTFLQTCEAYTPPASCRTLQDAYLAHLRSLRDLVAGLAPHSASDSPAGSLSPEEKDRLVHALQSATRAADNELTEVCMLHSLPKTLNIEVEPN